MKMSMSVFGHGVGGAWWVVGVGVCWDRDGFASSSEVSFSFIGPIAYTHFLYGGPIGSYLMQ